MRGNVGSTSGWNHAIALYIRMLIVSLFAGVLLWASLEARSGAGILIVVLIVLLWPVITTVLLFNEVDRLVSKRLNMYHSRVHGTSQGSTSQPRQQTSQQRTRTPPNHQMQATSSRQQSLDFSVETIEEKVAVGGAVLSFIGPFLPLNEYGTIWVDIPEGIAVVVISITVAGLILAREWERTEQIVTLILGGISVGIGWFLYSDLHMGDPGIGLYVTILGGLLIAGASIRRYLDSGKSEVTGQKQV